MRIITMKTYYNIVKSLECQIIELDKIRNNKGSREEEKKYMNLVLEDITNKEIHYYIEDTIDIIKAYLAYYEIKIKGKKFLEKVKIKKEANIEGVEYIYEQYYKWFNYDNKDNSVVFKEESPYTLVTNKNTGLTHKIYKGIKTKNTTFILTEQDFENLKRR